MKELRNLLEVETPLGRGIAILVSDVDHDTFWTVVLNDTRAIVTFRQHQLLAVRNYTMGWGMSDDDMREVLKNDTVRESKGMVDDITVKCIYTGDHYE